jgi:thiopurine S-methyltransferase
MEPKFWINAWNEGRTAFHHENFHEKLLQYFPSLGAKKDQSVFVPLCGKSKDMIWLAQQKLHVKGVELHEDAVKAFFAENHLPEPKLSEDSDFKTYSSQNIEISCGDFFKVSDEAIFDFVYDRAALVALPSSMRGNYAKKLLQVLKVGGRYLLITYEYDQTQMSGPPFSVDEREVRELFGQNFKIELLESLRPKDEGARLSALNEIKQNVYSLTLLFK